MLGTLWEDEGRRWHEEERCQGQEAGSYSYGDEEGRQKAKA